MPTEASRRHLRLPLGKVLLAALIVPWIQRRAFLRFMLYPALLFLAVRVALILLQSEGIGGALVWLAGPVYGAAFTVFAVRCHRLIILPSSASDSASVVGWSARETRFAAALTVSLVGAVMAMVGVVSALVRLLPAADDETFRWFVLAARGVAAYLFARLCLVLPALAVDRRVGFRWAWSASQGNGWRLAIIVALWPWLLDRAVVLLYRTDATYPEWVALTILAVLMAAIQVSALSLAYRELAAHLPDDEMRSTTRRWPALAGFAALMAAVLLLAAAPPVWIPLGTGERDAPCNLKVLGSQRSTSGRFEIVAEHLACDSGREPEILLTLREGNDGLVVYRKPASVQQAADWRRYMGWSWVADDRIDVLLFDKSDVDANHGQGRSWRGVQVRYRAVPPPGPAASGG